MPFFISWSQAESDGLVQVPSIMPPQPPAQALAAMAPKYKGGSEEEATRYVVALEYQISENYEFPIENVSMYDDLL